MRRILPSDVIEILERLENAGFSPAVVGGAVRDFLLGKTPADFDIASAALPQELFPLFPDFTILPTGIKHGTLTLLNGETSVEVTTFRTDGDYLDGRRPESVAFTRTLSDDLARRDFTINALAYSLSDGIIDLVGGLRDLSEKKIRCVGNPHTRFGEDALRILRAVRLAAVTGFDITPGTAAALAEQAPLLGAVSAERKTSELFKLLAAPHAVRAVSEHKPVFDVLFAPLAKVSLRDYARMCKALKSTSADAPLRLAAFFRFTNLLAPACSTFDDFFGPNLKFSGAETGKIRKLLDCSNDPNLIFSEVGTKKLLSRYNPDIVVGAAQLRSASDRLMGNSPAFDAEKYEDSIKKILVSGDCFRLSDLAVNGSDLIQIGIPTGKKNGEILAALLAETIENLVPNKRTSLLSRAAEMADTKD